MGLSKQKNVRVRYSDGQYTLEEWTLGAPIHCVEISQGEWECYRAFKKLDRYWHDRCRDLSHELYEKEHPPVAALIEGAVLDEDKLERVLALADEKWRSQ